MKYQVDFIAASFVRKASDIDFIRSVLGEEGAGIKIISKIENQVHPYTPISSWPVNNVWINIYQIYTSRVGRIRELRRYLGEDGRNNGCKR